MQSLHFLQAQYFQSPDSLQSAREIIDRKCRNMAHILLRTLPYRFKQYPEQAQIISHDHQTINKQQLLLPQCGTRQDIMLLEGRATRAYWSTVAVITKQPIGWHRVHPHAHDPFNIALNIGYSILARLIKEKIMRYETTPYIGILHAPRDNNEALVYDFEELYRQIAVDAAIIPLFSKKSEVPVSHTVASVLKKLDSRARYRDGFWKLSAIVDAEIGAYVYALHHGKIYIPYLHSHAHFVMPK